jgi:uncharacterized protein
VDTPQEPTRARIVPLFPKHATHAPAAFSTSTRRTAPAGDPASTSPADEPSDQLLDVSTIQDPLPGEQDGLSHVRAVQLAVSSGAFYPHIPTEGVPAAAARLGLGAVEIMLQTRGEYRPEYIATLRDNARAAGVQVYSVHTMHHLHPLMDRYPRRVAEGRALFQQAIEAAATLGATTLVWHGARREQVATDEGWERFIALTRELATACGEAGVTLAIENVSSCALAQVRNVVNFATRLNELGSPREIGFVFDPFQAAEAGANPFMMLAAMGNRIVNVHISDFSEHNPGARHLPPGDGDLPWSALVRAIAGSGYSGPMMIEGALGSDDTVITRVRDHLNPLIRSVFPFSPDANRHEDDDAVSILSALPAGVRKGITLFNQRRFFEQHEEIEHEWHAERGPVRKLYQGILQIGVGFYHALNGNHRGAMLLLTDGIEKTSAFTPHALGINTGRLVAEARRCRDQIAALGPDRLAEFDASLIPTIELDED